MQAIRAVYTIWLREFKVSVRERSRLVAMFAQPLLYLLVVGKGLTSAMTMRAAPGGIDYLKFMFPGIIGMSLLFTSIFAGASTIWDREFGFLKEVLVAPVSRAAVAMGKSLGGATTATIQAIILLALAPVVGVSLTAAVVAKILVVAFLISFAVTSLGVAIAGRMKSMQGFQMIMNFLVMPLYFLSGAMFPLSTAPAWMKVLMRIDPLTYGVDALRGLVFSSTTIQLPLGITEKLSVLARATGLVRWSLGFDVGVIAAVALVLAVAGALSLSGTE